ncbi:hypothetical protein M406DRAFT_341632 [Cryphonectria parasitica EP155]|uniref:Origin recognition complex subunit n=1 Tax=Cryphonectria parasitica (strain ATCC 38755 / EP155) TaxID=660469 RepID=A0A9P4XW66_CRYP1|nr:uncharacterized protein M406DRAFT_341632 [Cryphonectria parasitica EP155]KAF3762399.1 hypothetical protein M406DRAFT_341632 [Cryphonectria parasitica EP155]
MDRDETEFVHDDHRVAFVFGQDEETAERTSRPTKRRKVSKKSAAVEPKQRHHSDSTVDFFPLFNGAEKPTLVALRQKQFAASWAAINARIQNVLRDSNRTTLVAVSSFVQEAPAEEPGKIPTALIVTGPNVASQDLLFAQLAESLGQDAEGRRFVRLRSAEAPNLKATLKKIIRDGTRTAADEWEDAEIDSGKDGRKYLDYDLEALYAHIGHHECKQVIVAFQDSEAFDTALLTDLITLFNSWRDRIPFTLIFGIATSVELFEARLLKSTSQCLYGAQFDVVQMSSILESVFKCAVAHQGCSLKLGPVFLSSLVERQHIQVAGIQIFISSLKYAYMCHFYANPLSILLSRAASPQAEHNEALRNLPSFRTHVEDAVEAGRLKYARHLLENDEYLDQQRTAALKSTLNWEDRFLRSLALLEASEASQDDFITMYINALAEGIDLHSQESPILGSVRRMSATDISSLLGRLISVIHSGRSELGLKGWADEDPDTIRSLSGMAERTALLQVQAQRKGKPLRSQYSAQSRVLRTTVIAQKVQLSQDESNLTKEDKAFTELVDSVSALLATTISCQAADTVFLHELWMYESKSPYKDVFTPRLGSLLERALSRPHDYLACACCSHVVDGGNGASLPTTSILYHLYQETGALINVADLWSAFYGLIGMDEDAERRLESTSSESKSRSNDGYDERSALVLFYRGLADLKAMGFVKATRRRADHISKNKWLLTGLGQRRTRTNEALDKKLEQMALPLAPLVQLTSGHVHPAFPSTLLNFWLLTDAQLDEIAHFYHQRTPSPWTRHYPCPITWVEGLSLEEKRRKIGKFIGLRGCETPIIIKTEEQIMDEARQARIKKDGDEALRNKMSWYY